MPKRKNASFDDLKAIAGDEGNEATVQPGVLPSPLGPGEEVRISDGSANGQVTVAGTTTKPLESKSSKFRRLANRRVPRFVKVCKSIENLANTAQYECSSAERERLLLVVNQAHRTMTQAFVGREKITSDLF